jgi:hypothetical protein
MLRRLLSMTLMAALTVPPAQAIQVAVDEGLTRFKRSIDEYVHFRRHLDQQLPPLNTTSDAQRLHEAVEARAAAIRRARKRAQREEMFNAEVSTLFRMRIREVFDGQPDVAADLRREMMQHGQVRQPPDVNDRFSWAIAVATPPSVLSVLPALPDQLQYRFVGPHLVLVDVDANLVLDVMPGVLPVGPLSGQGYQQAADVTVTSRLLM